MDFSGFALSAQRFLERAKWQTDAAQKETKRRKNTAKQPRIDSPSFGARQRRPTSYFGDRLKRWAGGAGAAALAAVTAADLEIKAAE